MKRFYWSGISNDERTKSISEIISIVDRYGTILNFKRFSDISLSIILETEECRLHELKISLKDIVLLDDNDTNPGDSKSDCIVLLHILFTKGTGDLEIEIPDIPE